MNLEFLLQKAVRMRCCSAPKNTVYIYSVSNKNSLPPQSKLCMSEKIKTPTGSPFNSTYLLKSSVDSVSSNGVTINLKKEGPKKKDSKALKYL